MMSEQSRAKLKQGQNVTGPKFGMETNGIVMTGDVPVGLVCGQTTTKTKRIRAEDRVETFQDKKTNGRNCLWPKHPRTESQVGEKITDGFGKCTS